MGHEDGQARPAHLLEVSGLRGKGKREKGLTKVTESQFFICSSLFPFLTIRKIVIRYALSAAVHLKQLPDHISTVVQDLSRC
jgi:hypothetical protein